MILTSVDGCVMTSLLYLAFGAVRVLRVRRYCDEEPQHRANRKEARHHEQRVRVACLRICTCASHHMRDRFRLATLTEATNPVCRQQSAGSS